MNKLILNKEEILKKLGKEYIGLTNIISDKFGIINAILERKELKKYDLYMYQCLSANAKDLFNLNREVSSGGLGVNESEKYAIISCLAEALERYSMSYIPKSEIVYDYYKNLKNTLSDYSLYSKEQYSKHKEFINLYKDKAHFTKIYSISNSKKYIYYPASLIYLPFIKDKSVAETTSTGMAAGSSLDDCIQSGLLELIERDSLMINFYQKLNPPKLNLKTIKGKNKKLIDKIKEEYEVVIYELYTDLLAPVYLSFIWKNTKKGIHFGIGACANLDSDYAIEKSLKECLFTYFYSENIMDVRKTNKDEITALYEHFLYYQRENFESLLFDSKEIDYKKRTITFNELVKHLKNNNIDVYYKDLTTVDIKETNIKVVKVICPGLIDLNKSHVLPRLGAKRFWEVPKKLGLKTNKELNSNPHPFP